MKKYNLVVKEDADQEIIDAYLWYEERSEGLGERFLSCLDECFETICKNPNTFQKVHKKVRQAIVSVFPFVVIYEKGDKEVIVYAVFHTSKDPTNWKDKS
mgnify:CR=1 FL=1